MQVQNELVNESERTDLRITSNQNKQKFNESKERAGADMSLRTITEDNNLIAAFRG
jgi:hypothetical protein